MTGLRSRIDEGIFRASEGAAHNIEPKLKDDLIYVGGSDFSANVRTECSANDRIDAPHAGCNVQLSQAVR
jgi:hypothetical protein